MRFKQYAVLFALFSAVLIFSPATANADVKMKTRQTAGGETSEGTVYVKGKRQRSERETGGVASVDLMQCDLRRSVQVMPQSKTYLINLWNQAEGATTPPQPRAGAGPSATTRGGLVTTTITTKDTGERKQMFGYTARHLITTIETESAPDSCDPNQKTKMETDGWYIDAEFALDCAGQMPAGYAANGSQGGCRDRYELKQIGAAKRGYPVWEKMTLFDQDGKELTSTVSEVLELSTTALDAALFEIPEGYREVKDSSELYASMSLSTSGQNRGSSLPTASDSNAFGSMRSSGDASGDRSFGSRGDDSADVSAGPKRAGVVRLGLVAVKTAAAGEGVNAAELSAGVGNTVAEYLRGVPNVELVQIGSKLPAAIDAEARQKECDFVLHLSVSHKKGGGGGFGGMFGKVVAPAVGRVGIGQTGSVAGNIAGQAATQAIVSAGAVARGVKSRDELTLDLKVQRPGDAAVAVGKQFKAKAKSDGEDLVTPLVEQAAQLIADAASKR